MKTKKIIALCLFLLAAVPGLSLARSDTQFYRNDKCVCFADPTTLEHIGGPVYEIWVTVEFFDESVPTAFLVEHVDMNRYASRRKRMFIREGPREVDLPLGDVGEWHTIPAGSMDEALYDFLYELLRRKGKI